MADSYPSEHTQALDVAGRAPEQVTTDGHDAYPRAIRETLGDGVEHRTSRYKNNRIEQDHRGIKQRYDPMRGFGSFTSASRFCCAFDELRNYLQPCRIPGEAMSLTEQRRLFQEKLAALRLQVRMTS